MPSLPSVLIDIYTMRVFKQAKIPRRRQGRWVVTLYRSASLQSMSSSVSLVPDNYRFSLISQKVKPLKSIIYFIIVIISFSSHIKHDPLSKYFVFWCDQQGPTINICWWCETKTTSWLSWPGCWGRRRCWPRHWEPSWSWRVSCSEGRGASPLGQRGSTGSGDLETH